MSNGKRRLNLWEVGSHIQGLTDKYCLNSDLAIIFKGNNNQHLEFENWLPSTIPKIYVDNYDNVVTNISKKTFIEFGKSRSFEINARNYIFKEIVSSYGNAIRFDIKKENRKEIGKKIALFNKSNYLELSIYKSNPETFGGAASLFGLNYRDVITIKFN